MRSFGRYLDTSALVPGDLILFHAKRPNIAQKAIIGAQRRGGYGNEDARWHHAAVYTGEDFVLEAVLSGVRHHPLFTYFPRYLIRVRRDASLTDAQRLSLVVKAMSAMRRGYSLAQLPFLYLESLHWYWRPAPPDKPSSITICSKVFARSYAVATKRYLCDPARVVKPADLSITPQLSDVRLSWQLIA